MNARPLEALVRLAESLEGLTVHELRACETIKQSMARVRKLTVDQAKQYLKDWNRIVGGDDGEEDRSKEEYFQRLQAAAQRMEEGGEPFWAAIGWLRLGQVSIQSSRLAEAQERCEKAYKILKQAGHRGVQGDAASYLGVALDMSGQASEAYGYFDEAATIFRELELPDREAMALGNAGGALTNLGRYEEADAVLKKSLEIARRLKNPALEANALNNLGVSLFNQSRLQEAIQHYVQARKLYQSVQDVWRESHSLNGLGNAFMTLGRYEEALEYLNLSLKTKRAFSDRTGEAMVLQSIGTTYSEMRRYAEALRTLEEALALHRASGTRSGEIGVLNNLGNVYRELGRPQEAFERFLDALEIEKALARKTDQAMTLSNLGSVLLELGAYAQALSFSGESASIARELKLTRVEAKALHNAAVVLGITGKTDEAGKHFDQCLKIFRDTGDRPGEALTLMERGYLLKDEASLKASVQAFEDLGDKSGAALSLSHLALVQREGSLESLVKAIELYEQLRVNTGMMESAKRGFQEKRRWCYELTIRRLSEAGRHPEAVNLMERLKARALLDWLGSKETPFRKTSGDLFRRKREAAEAFNASRARLEKLSGDERVEASRNHRRLLDELQELQRQVELQWPVEEVKPASLEEIQAVLKEGEGLLLYTVTYPIDEKTGVTRRDPTILAVLVTRESAGAVHELSASVERASWFATAAAATARGYSMDEFRKRARELYESLIKPFESELGKISRLIVSADGFLCGVPFEAVGDREFLGARFEIAYTYSGTILQRRRAKGAPEVQDPVAAFGDPDYGQAGPSGAVRGSAAIRENAPADLKPFLQEASGERGGWSRLPQSGAESRSMADLFGGKAYLGVDASEARAVEIRKARILHFACHGVADAYDPMRSALVLTRGDKHDGYLEAWEISELQLECDLVVLSACHSGQGEMARGEGLIGLTRAWMLAGAKSVVGSLWAVSDEGGREFMASFYRRIKAGQTRSAALAETKREFMGHAKYSAPYYWAGFVLHGE